MSTTRVNLANRLRIMAERFPDKPAIIRYRGTDGKGNGRVAESVAFGEFDRDSDAAARGLAAAGITRGMKTLVMLRPSLTFFSGFFALFKLGAVPVFIDPGMGVRRLLECVRNLRPEAMLGAPLAHLVRVTFRRNFPDCKIAVTDGRRWLWGGEKWGEMKRYDDLPLPIADTAGDDLAAILFTTGSTGPAKGVEYAHAALDRQIDLLAQVFAITPEDRDAATFPGFSLFSVALGMTAVVPDLNPVRPGRANPERIFEAVRGGGCTFSFGSPALWGRVSEYAVRQGVKLPQLRKVIMAGAPVGAEVHRRLLSGMLAADAETFTPYGATEGMPVACIGGREVLAETAELTAEGKGVCVGRAVPGARVEIIRLLDGPIAAWDEDLLLGPGEIGEIAVQGEHISRHYHNLPAADALAKIPHGDQFWHRMGDAGYKDATGRIWFCGRKAHRVRTRGGDLFTVCCEARFNRHPEVARSALVGVPEGGSGCERPVLVVQLREEAKRKGEEERIRRELLAAAVDNPLTAGIRDILFYKVFPTDIRHNAKIRREELAKWAAGRVIPRPA